MNSETLPGEQRTGIGRPAAQPASTSISGRLSILLITALILGVGVGLACHLYVPSGSRLATIASSFELLSDLFLRLIKMVVAPLILSTVTLGIVRLGQSSKIGRVALVTFTWFFFASIVSLLLGIGLALALRPGAALAATMNFAAAVPPADVLTAGTFLARLVPVSIFDALASNEILQVVVFACFFGMAIAAVGETAAPLVRLMEGVIAVMFRVTQYVMWVAPAGVFGAIAALVAKRGSSTLFAYAALLGSFYAALAVLLLCLLGVGGLLLGRRLAELLKAIKESVLIAFSAASSEAALPQLLCALDEFGIPSRLASFILPIGYSFNLNGTAMYCSFAVLFIAQVCGVHLGRQDLVLLVLLLFVMGKGIATVPRGSLIIIAAVLPYFHLPSSAIGFVLGVDHFMDMGRSGTNIVGNALAAAGIARLEGALEPARPQEM